MSFGRKPITIAAMDDRAKFLEKLSGAMEQLGWEIVRQPSQEITSMTVRRPSTYKIILRYAHHEQNVNRIIIQVLFGGRDKENLNYEALFLANQLNNDYNLLKIAFDEDGDVWCETVFPFGTSLDVYDLSAYLEWWDTALTVWGKEHLRQFIGD